MKRTSLVVAGFSAMIALGLIGYGCTSGDTVGGTGGSKGSGGQTTGGGQGGQTTGGGQGGQTTGGGQGGQTTGGGEGGATGGGQGGATGGGQGGATGGGQGGATGGGQGGMTGGLAVCPSPAPADKSTCDPATAVSPCTKNCGVKAEATQPRAQKPCTCNTVAGVSTWDCTNAGACVYPPNFVKTCFALTPAPAACPAMTISNVSTCTNTTGATCGPLCGSATVPSYSTGTAAAPSAPKVGYCACVNGIWQCASVNEWPM
jgi:hypothetical protein